MKFIKFIGISALLFTLCGCQSTTCNQYVSHETYDTMKLYHQKIGGKCKQYMYNDPSVSGRDLNTYLIYYKNMQQILDTIDVKN